MTEYRISFSQRTTLSTAFGPVEAQGDRYYLKATSLCRRSRQHVGYAVVRPDRSIEVSTVDGTPVGVARTRKEAGQLIDGYHRDHNADSYWMWAEKTLV